MQIETLISHGNPEKELASSKLRDATVVLYFLSPAYPDKDAYLKALYIAYPGARLLGCTTSGEICGKEALSGTAISTAIKLQHTSIKIASTSVDNIHDSLGAGKKLASELNLPQLRLLFVLSDGLCVNGSDLVTGLSENLPEGITITGGLAGDGSSFKQTGIGVDGLPISGKVAAIGFYGDRFKVSCGSVGGWLKFGPERTITRSHENIIYELDEKPALELYKKYLGDEAQNLPGSGLLFPLSIRPDSKSPHDIVRTIVGIDEKENSLIFAGDVPQGYIAQLMRGSSDNLVDGAIEAATIARESLKGNSANASLGILVSCVGRNLLMGQSVSDEVEAVKTILGETQLTGFYSYGEICHHPITHQCSLHNQTMTITLIAEA
ncbi:MAG TPA: FIST N-terminal domain-containing protein [Rickettsiales bacterium]|nr:FIST N-terminal domain-containing protein [Rickettsiales bacterium]